VIDKETKERLIAEDSRSAEVIKPFLAGREIKRYQTPTPEKYLILFPKGFTIKSNLPKDDPNYISQMNEPPRYGYMNYDPAWQWLQSNYPAIANHLKSYENAAKKRTDQGDFWWELRACDYYGEFEKEKIIYPNICKGPEFTFDSSSTYANQKCFIISKYDKGLLGILNSQVSYFLFDQILPKLRGGFFEPSYLYFKDFPILKDETGRIDLLVEEILNLKNHDPYAETKELENKIDQLVYELYGLSREEIGIVEGGV
jgi:adenine-specific DNA-methyltransferase